MVSWLGMEKLGDAWDRFPGLLSGVGRPNVNGAEDGGATAGVDRGFCGVEKEDICSSLVTGATCTGAWLSEEGEVPEELLLVAGGELTTGLVSARKIIVVRICIIYIDSYII